MIPFSIYVILYCAETLQLFTNVVMKVTVTSKCANFLWREGQTWRQSTREAALSKQRAFAVSKLTRCVAGGAELPLKKPSTVATATLSRIFAASMRRNNNTTARVHTLRIIFKHFLSSWCQFVLVYVIYLHIQCISHVTFTSHIVSTSTLNSGRCLCMLNMHF
jgi:hypothetical protein